MWDVYVLCGCTSMYIRISIYNYVYVYTYIIYIHIAFHTRKNDMAVLYYESHGKFHHDLRYTSVSLKADQGLQLM